MVATGIVQVFVPPHAPDLVQVLALAAVLETVRDGV